MSSCETCKYFDYEEDDFPCGNCKGTVSEFDPRHSIRPNFYERIESDSGDDTECRIRDSGNRREFESGAVRDIQEGKGRCDLLPLGAVAKIYTRLGNTKVSDTLAYIRGYENTGSTGYLERALINFGREYYKDDFHSLFIEVSIHFEEGAKKYGVDNWKKGIPTNCYIDSALRHFFKYLRGDNDEPHGRAFVWNLLACIWTCDNKPELNVYKEAKSNE